jgi:hypothetical protein
MLIRRLLPAMLCLAALGLAVGAEDLAKPAGSQVFAADSTFKAVTDSGAITSLRPARLNPDTEFVMPDRRLGDILVNYRRPGEQSWTTAHTARGSDEPGLEEAVTDRHLSHWTYPGNQGTNGLALRSEFILREGAIEWKATVRNGSDHSLEIGDLALPLPMNSRFRRTRGVTTGVLKHSFISGHNSYIFWMRADSAPPYLLLTPLPGTSLEYWDNLDGAYKVYIHSAAAGAIAKEKGTRWRQPNTSATLAAGSSLQYGFKLQWAAGYEEVRNALVQEGLLDVQVVPGMVVPNDLSARFAIRSREPIHSIEPEFPADTRIAFIGRNGEHSIYQATFSRLGENRLTLSYGKQRTSYLEFFCTEPLETLIRKRAAFIAKSQHRDPSKWYNGLISEWNLETQVLLGPDNYDRIRGWRIYAVSCDDPGLSKPAFLAAKNTEMPEQSEIEAMDYYLKNFVWGGLQRTTEEEYPYGIYGIPDWKRNRESTDPGRNGRLHIWRVYDYPHVVLMYHSMYRTARNFPEMKTALSAREYLQRAAGTAIAMFTVPYQVEKWSGYRTGFYNELVIVDLIKDLEASGMSAEARELRMHWERKVQFFVNGDPDLFGSEYPFDSTGFESTQALARYAALRDDEPYPDGKGAIPPAKIRNFMEQQMAANIFCRGWLEPAYYYLGSDYRAGAGNAYTLSYMAPMGGWAVLDYAMHFSTNPPPLLRLGYASYLSSWALMNTGTEASNYGFWFPGKANDGGAGGGFEPAPYGQTWLGQPHHRGSWYYACETDLGYCGSLRMATTLVSDDPIFGRFCFGGDLQTRGELTAIIPKDGLRRRFDALLTDGKLHVDLEAGRFAKDNPIQFASGFSTVRLPIENNRAGTVSIRISGPLAQELSPAENTTHISAVSRTERESRLNVKLDGTGKPLIIQLSRKK